MKNFCVLFSFLMALFFSCKSELNSDKYLSSGYAFENFTKLKGELPQKTEVVTVDFQIIDDFENVLSDSRNAGIRPTIQIPENPDAKMARNPLLSLVNVMAKGDSAAVYVPVDSLNSPPKEFLKSKMVAYHVKVLNIEDQDVYMQRMGAQQQAIEHKAYAEAKEVFDAYIAGDFKNDVIEKNHNVKIVLINAPDGPKAELDELVSVNYYGFFKDGSSFDNSFKVGRPYSFKIGHGTVIEGWDIAIPDVPKGGSAIIEIPWPMAYGKEGKTGFIPPHSDLIFWVRVEEVEKKKNVSKQ